VLQGGIDKRVIEKFEKEAAEMNKRSFKYAWVSIFCPVLPCLSFPRWYSQWLAPQKARWQTKDLSAVHVEREDMLVDRVRCGCGAYFCFTSSLWGYNIGGSFRSFVSLIARRIRVLVMLEGSTARAY